MTSARRNHIYIYTVILQIHNSNTFVDDFMAEARIDTHNCDEAGKKKKFELFGRKKEKDLIMPGNLHVHIKSSYDLSAL